MTVQNNNSVPTSQVIVGEKYHMNERLLKLGRRGGGNDMVDGMSTMAAASDTTATPSSCPLHHQLTTTGMETL